MDNIFSWLLPTSEKAYVDMSKMTTLAQQEVQAKIEQAKVAQTELPWQTHRELGKAIGEAIGIVLTKDVYGQGPEPHGSAWKVAGDKYADAEQWLTENGFKKRGSYAWFQGKFRVDVGKDTKNTYLYITDDETSTKEKRRLRRWRMKHLPGQHEQLLHGNREGIHTGWVTDDEDRMRAERIEPVLSNRFGVGIGPKKAIIQVNEIMGDVEGHKGEFAVYYKVEGVNIEKQYLKTKQEAIVKAEEMLLWPPEGYRDFSRALKIQGKKLISKYAGKDIYGNSFEAGTPIIYSSKGVILDNESTS